VPIEPSLFALVLPLITHLRVDLKTQRMGKLREWPHRPWSHILHYHLSFFFSLLSNSPTWWMLLWTHTRSHLLSFHSLTLHHDHICAHAIWHHVVKRGIREKRWPGVVDVHASHVIMPTKCCQGLDACTAAPPLSHTALLSCPPSLAN
jgi:hypothetical protein